MGLKGARWPGAVAPQAGQERVLTPDAAGYPEGLRRCLGEEAPGSVRVLGNTGVLARDLLALFCSVRCPGGLILQTYDLAQALREQGVAVIGGFHSPMEQECLRLLLRGRQPVVACPARSIEGMRVPVAWRGPVDAGRLLVVSPFEEKERRVTGDLAERRNRFVAALAERVFISHAEPGGGMETLARHVVGWGKPVFTFAGEENEALFRVGARAVADGSALVAALG